MPKILMLNVINYSKKFNNKHSDTLFQTLCMGGPSSLLERGGKRRGCFNPVDSS